MTACCAPANSSPFSGQQHKDIISSLNGLRGFACLCVLLRHANVEGVTYNSTLLGIINPIFGVTGVAIFFSLSAFLMVYRYVPTRCAPRYWCGFFIRRFFRIYPSFAIVVPLYWIMDRLAPGDFFYLPDCHLAGHLLLQCGVYHFWTIPVEFRFYLLFPILALWLTFSNAYLTFILLCLLEGLSIYAMPAGGDCSLWPYLSYFLGGTIAGYIYVFSRTGSLFSPKTWSCIFWAFFLLFITCDNRLNAVELPMNHHYTYWFDARYLAPLSIILLLSLAYSGGLAKRVFSSRPFQLAGDMSYSLYLLHLIFFRWGPRWLPVQNPFVLVALHTTVLLAGFLFYRYIDGPLYRMGKNLARRVENGKKEAARSMERYQP